MKRVSAIKAQLRRVDRFSVFIDDNYAFSLSRNALLDSKLKVGQTLDEKELKKLEQLAAEDKLYNRVLYRLSLRARSEAEIRLFLRTNHAKPELIESIIERLKSLGLINDGAFAESYVSQRRRMRPTSRRKLQAELKRKGINGELAEQVIGDEQAELSELKRLIEKLRQRPRYQDDLKLMQYLARQGFTYGAIKSAIKDS